MIHIPLYRKCFLKLAFIFVLNACSFCFLQVSCSAPRITRNGGILPYYYDEKTKELSFLLGKEDRNIKYNRNNEKINITAYWWQDFGGDLELKEDQKNYVNMFKACLRECYEELHVIFPSFIPQNSNNIDLSNFHYVQTNNYTVFLIRISKKITPDFLPSYFLSFDQREDNFIFQPFHDVNAIEKESAFNEKYEYKWFTLAEISDLIVKTQEYFETLATQCLPDKQTTSTEDLYKQTISKDDLFFRSFINIFQNNTDQGENNLLTSSIKDFFNSEDNFSKKPVFHVQKWFTHICCALYQKSNMDGRIFSEQKYVVENNFDTIEQFKELFSSIEKVVSAVNYDKTDIRNFLNTIHFQINRDLQIAYCALEVEKISYISNNNSHIVNKEDYQKYIANFLSTFPQKNSLESIWPKRIVYFASVAVIAILFFLYCHKTL